jgi:hypothetical protein
LQRAGTIERPRVSGRGIAPPRVRFAAPVVPASSSLPNGAARAPPLRARAGCGAGPVADPAYAVRAHRPACELLRREPEQVVVGGAASDLDSTVAREPPVRTPGSRCRHTAPPSATAGTSLTWRFADGRLRDATDCEWRSGRIRSMSFASPAEADAARLVADGDLAERRALLCRSGDRVPAERRRRPAGRACALPRDLSRISARGRANDRSRRVP